MANAVVVPEWLKRLPMAPEFYPTETEFADPIAYISKIEKEASAFGICKIIPPIPKPSKKHVFENLNKSLSKRPELGSDVNCRVSGCEFPKSGGEKNHEEVRAVFTTRQQELGQCVKRARGMGDPLQPSAQKQMWQSGEVYTLEQFEAKAKVFSRDILGKIEDISPLVIETLFWKAAGEKPIYVEYANDVPGSAFSEHMGPVRRIHGYKTPGRRVFTQNKCVNRDDECTVVTAKNISMDEGIDASTGYVPSTTTESGKIDNDALTLRPDEGSEASRQKKLPHNHGRERTAGWKLSNSPWNLQVISRSAGSLTRFMLDDIPGVTSPMIYIGMLFSWFAWHVEDHELHSLNFLHTGSPKTWYAVPGEYAFAFEEVICTEANADNLDILASLAFLGEKTTIISPEVITRRGIPCCRLVQNPGEFVVTFPRAYHIGFSHGFNCGEAANFGTPEWLKVAKEAAVRRTIMDHLPMLSHQQLLYLLTMSFVSRIPISLLPGIRSSRLRNRQKEARELLVKKAFIEDVLESNNLVNDLLQKDSSFRAVLWNSNSLPPFGSESVSQTGVSAESTSSKNDKPAVCLKDDNDLVNLYDQITLHMQTLDDFDIFDLSGDFEISSGTLPCVACGVLGFPYMCVVQPSRKASRNILPADCISVHGEPEDLQTRKPKPRNNFKGSVSAMATEFDERWNSCGFLRPRVFCPEHAVQTEDLLRPKGGANVLVICHSDFQKIKPTVSVIAEEIGSAFGYKEVSLDFASIQDLNLINLAIDKEPNDCREDWTSNLGINLKHLVKARKNSPEKPLEHKLKLCGFFPFATPMPDMSKLMWKCRKSRMKRLKSKPTHQEHVRSCGNIHEKKNEAVDGEEVIKSSDIIHVEKDNTVLGNADGRMLRKVNVHFQYSRRKCRSKSDKLVEARSTVECPIKHPHDFSTNCGNICSEERDMSVGNALNNKDTDIVQFSVPASVQGYLEQSETTKNAVESCILTDHECQQPSVGTTFGCVSSQIMNCTSEELKMEVEGTSSTASYCSKIQLDVKNNAQTSEISEISDAENSCLSAIMSRECSVDRGKCMESGKNFRGEARNMLIPRRTLEGFSARADEDIAKDKTLNVPERTISCVAETSHTFQDKFVMDIEVSDCKALEITHENDRHMKELVPSHAHLAHRKPENVSSTGAGVADAETTLRNQQRRKREVIEHGCVLNQGGFVKSPCEGLRPRIRKEEVNGQSRRDTAKAAEEPPTKKKKPSGASVPGNEEGVETPKGTYRFGKRFSSDRKPVNHQGVHDKEEHLECTWKGCKMTFNLESLRMEHMQMHSGTRPYQCEFEGCGIAFKYPSELSRHRRRTGHNADHGGPV